MRKLFILLIMVALSITGCMGNKGEPGMIGYVMDKDNGRILVVDPIAQDFSSTGGIEEFYNAIWFSGAPEKINVGDKVEVWFDSVAESYPGQSEGKDSKVVQEKKPEGADLTPSQALHRALVSNEVNKVMVPYSIEYDEKQDSWKIQLKEILGESGEVLEFEIED